MKSLIRIALSLAAAFVALAFVLWGFGHLMSSKEPRTYTAEALRQAAEARKPRLDLEAPPRIQRQVDYTEGPAAPWYPKGEPPVLGPLVESGALPPVAERVGPEPCVVEGVEGIGRYGGTWIRAATADYDAFAVIGHRLSYSNLVRFSPQGDPLVPHVAKGFQVSDDYRTFTFRLRRGMRWSDGHPFTADDILYWWECEAADETITSVYVPGFMKVRGGRGTVERLGPYEVRFTFPEPNGLFLPKLARFAGREVVGSPAHYLRPCHPVHGDRERLDALRKEHGLQSDLAAYRFVKELTNPDHPRLWPWICRSERPNPPYSFVRNPYYGVVDSEGNQLPYIDRVHFEVRRPEMVAVAAANGELSMQARAIGYDTYTLLMSECERGGYEVRHWYPDIGSMFLISPNLNRKTDYADPARRREAENKHRLLNDKRFRQALSLAINRQEIIDAERHGRAEPAQNAPGPGSYFYEPALFHSFTAYDPERARRLLDDIGLTRRDTEGFRTFPDGTEMTFYLELGRGGTFAGLAQFVIEDWRDVGIRARLRIRSPQLFYTEKAAREHDMNAWSGGSVFLPILNPYNFVPLHGESNYAPGFAVWYAQGGLYGDPKAAETPGAIEPPEDHPLRQAMVLYDRVRATGDRVEQREVFGEILRLAAENVWTIGICTPPPELAVVADGFHNVPEDVVAGWDFQTPGNAGLETYYFAHPHDSPGARRHVRRALAPAAGAGRAGRTVGGLIRWLITGVVGLLVVAVAVRHPYVARRLAIMVPTLIIVSVVVFVVIQLPPGSFVESRIMALRQSGDEANLQQVRELEERFHLRESMVERYAWWLGLKWFATGEDEDRGLLQGNLGRSMETGRTVNEIVGDRILLTFLISLGTILLTWAVAVPVGIYSAIRRYTTADYLLTFVGFIGMCVPSFLLALLLIYAAKEVLGLNVSGLFSSQYGAQPEWDWPKVADMLGHIWVPVVVLGVAGTAGMIRVMRANLLDELRKPYVTAARARGVRPVKLLLKYPVRLALNPFISGIGGIFPQLVSGGAIVAMVLSLPTIGPLMLGALMSEDMYLAGSMLMVLSLLGVFGTLVSDLLLLWLDPRIRFKGGTR